MALPVVYQRINAHTYTPHSAYTPLWDVSAERDIWHEMRCGTYRCLSHSVLNQAVPGGMVDVSWSAVDYMGPGSNVVV